jgi:SAM-dependent methyltransferase
MDVAQIMSCPPAPAKILDVGVGNGWTSDFFARAGYEVTALDISSDMIDIARQRTCSALFMVADYEAGPIGDMFDAAVIYDALHHSDDEYLVIAPQFQFVSFPADLVAVPSAMIIWLASFDRGYAVPAGWLHDAVLFLGARSYALDIIHVPEMAFRIAKQEELLKLV